MNYKFTIEDLMIRVMPGGFLLAILYLIFNTKLQINLTDNLDFLYTFLFFCSSFIVGELLQTLAHEIEWIIDIFFKFRRPSKVFLYKGNPVLKIEHKRKELLKKLNLPENELNVFNKEYSKLSIFWWKKNKTDDSLSQSIFWRIYSQVSNSEEIKTSNRNYLFTRVITMEFLLISIIFFLDKNMYLGYMNFAIFLIFLWRSRGIARGLIFKTVLLNLKK